MVRRYYGLPPLNSLAVFEAAARHANFKRAADELNVTPGAVSRQIKSLEEDLGVSLFVRNGMGVTLSPAAEDLFLAVSSSFERCSEAIQAARLGQKSEIVTIACTDAFSTFWLMPRMVDFWEKYPEISVNHIVSDNVRDFRRTEIDLRIRPGGGKWANERSELLFGDNIYLVCGTRFAQEHMGVEVSDIPTLPLLHMDWTDPEWPRWDDFFRLASIAHNSRPGRRFGKYSVLLTAAEANQGIAMGWERLVQPLIEQNKLERFTDISIAAPIGYYITWHQTKSLSRAAEVLKKWILEQAERESHE